MEAIVPLKKCLVSLDERYLLVVQNAPAYRHCNLALTESHNAMHSALQHLKRGLAVLSVAGRLHDVLVRGKHNGHHVHLHLLTDRPMPVADQIA